MSAPSNVLSFVLLVHSSGHLLYSVVGEPTELGTNVAVSHASGITQKEMSFIAHDVFEMIVGSILNPDSYRLDGTEYDAEGKRIEEDDDGSYIPF